MACLQRVLVQRRASSPTLFRRCVTHHCSLDTQYDLGHQYGCDVGYQGSCPVISSSIRIPMPSRRPWATTLNPQIGGGDYWAVNGTRQLQRLARGIEASTSRTSLWPTRNSSGPRVSTPVPLLTTEQPYPYNLSLDYGRSDYDVGKAFKLYGMWQPVFFHGSKAWLEKIVGGWSLSGILNIHSGFPWTPLVSVSNPNPKDPGGSLYCDTCGYSDTAARCLLGWCRQQHQQ